jgi:hypothetical protein
MERSAPVARRLALSPLMASAGRNAEPT